MVFRRPISASQINFSTLILIISLCEPSHAYHKKDLLKDFLTCARPVISYALAPTNAKFCFVFCAKTRIADDWRDVGPIQIYQIIARQKNYLFSVSTETTT